MAKATFTAKEGEQVFAQKVAADCWRQPAVIGKRQISGRAYFTDQRVVFLASGLVGTDKVSWEIALSDIQTVSPCLTPPFFPFGIKMILKNGHPYVRAIWGPNTSAKVFSAHVSFYPGPARPWPRPRGCILGMPAGLYTGYSQNDEIIAISLVASTQIPL